MTKTSNRPTEELLNQIITAFNDHDIDKLAEYFAEDGEMLLAAGPEIWGTRIVGRSAIKKALKDRFAAVPNLRWTEGRNWIMGEKVLSEWRVRGTPAHGKEINCLGCDLWEFEGAKIKKKDTYYKTVTA